MPADPDERFSIEDQNFEQVMKKLLGSDESDEDEKRDKGAGDG